MAFHPPTSAGGGLASSDIDTSAKIAAIVTDETGTGALAFATSPTLVTPILGTPTSGTLTNCTGLPVAGITASTSTALGVGSIELGHASDTTIARSSAGVVTIEGVVVDTASNTLELTNKTLNASVGKGTWTASGTWTLPAMTFGGAVQLTENAPIMLDAAGSADGKYSGITIAGTAGATLAFGDLVYLAAADSRWELADADAAATAGDVQLGMCVLAAAADGDPTTILLYGNIRADANFPALTIGAPAYVSTTAGDIQVAKPSGTDDVIRRVGFALTADELLFNPSNDYVTVV